MLYPRVTGSSATQVLIPLFYALLMTACTTEDSITCANQDANSSSASCTDSSPNPNPTPDPDPSPNPDPAPDPAPDPDPDPLPEPDPVPEHVNVAPTTSTVILNAIDEDSGVRIITQAELLANASDADGDALTATGLVITSGAGALVSNNDGSWNYTAAPDDDTSVSFGYNVTDGALSADGTALLDIVPEHVNVAPTTSTVILNAIDEDSGVRIITQAELLANASDADGDALTATGLVITSGAGALVSNNDGSWNYTAAPDDDTFVIFGYNVTDGALSADGTALLDIVPEHVNVAPTTSTVILNAIDEDSGVRIITQAELLANASDTDGDDLTATGLVITSGAGALVSNNDGSWNYTTAPDDDTFVSFGYNVTDGALSADGTALLDIRPVNDPDNITLTWTAPVTRENGNPIMMSEISGYRIYYGTAPDDYAFQIDIDDSSVDRLILNEMSPGTYYFVLTCIDMDGRESPFSDMVMKHI